MLPSQGELGGGGFERGAPWEVHGEGGSLLLSSHLKDKEPSLLVFSLNLGFVS